jgi:hypothetical protein
VLKRSYNAAELLPNSEDVMRMNAYQSDFTMCFRTEDSNTILFQSQKLVLFVLSYYFMLNIALWSTGLAMLHSL